MAWQFVVNGIIAGSVYALTALSLIIIYLPTRFFHFAHGAVFAWGAYFCYILINLLQIPIYIALPVAVSLSAGIGVGLEVLVYRRLRQRGASALVMLLSSLGLYVVLQNLISLLMGDDSKILQSDVVAEGIVFWGARITFVQAWIIAISIFCFISVWMVLKFTRFGMAFRAVSSDPELALIRGIDTERVVLGAFAFGSGLAGLAAILVSLDVDMTPTMGLNALMAAVVAMIAGGSRSLPGALLGGLLLGLAQHLGVWKIGSQWQDTIAFVILLVFLTFRPFGLLGRPLKKVEV